MPITAFIGVRISWLIVARNALFASLAASAAARASCGLLEQPRVLDRDHGLVGEGLQQRDLLVGERPRRLAHDADRADAAVFPQHRRARDRVVADQLEHVRARRRRTRSSRPHRGCAAVRRSRIACRRHACRRAAWGTCCDDRIERRAAPGGRRAPGRRRRPGRCRAARSANRCWQLSRILSNTGAVSATELLITCSTSAVAVCCSSASLVSLNRRAFWIAITAWSAKVLSSAISLSVNGTGGWRRQHDRADAARLRAASARQTAE